MKAVYDFSEASGSNKKLLGGKGAGLSEMTRLKLPVPPGFVITTEVCKAYYANGKKLHREVLAQDGMIQQHCKDGAISSLALANSME